MRHGLSTSLVLASFVRKLNYRTGLPKSRVLEVREKKKIGSPWCGLSRVLGVPDGAPPPMPMVFLERSYVREVLVLQCREGWGWGRIATPARNVPGGLVVGYSGRA